MKEPPSDGKWREILLDTCGIMYGYEARIDVDNEVTMRKIETLLDKQSSLHYFPTQTRKTFLDEIL